jgi:hypothetical protein
MKKKYDSGRKKAVVRFLKRLPVTVNRNSKIEKEFPQVCESILAKIGMTQANLKPLE